MTADQQERPDAVPPAGPERLPAAFGLLYSGETISLFGTAITSIALPLTASVMLRAGQFEMGLLSAVGWLPILLFGLIAGTYADRVSKWRILFSSNLARALILGVIPLLAALSELSIGALLIIAFTAGIANVLFDVSYQSYVPDLVPDRQLGLANSRYELSRSAAQITGPLIGGALASAILPAYAIGIDAASFMVAAMGLLLMRFGRFRPVRTGHELAAPADSPPRSFRADLVAGQRVVWKSPALRVIVLSGALANIFISGIDALFVLFVTRTLGYGSLMVGISLACAGGGAIVGALLYQRIDRRIGEPGCIALGLASITLGAVLLPCSAIAMSAVFLVCSQLAFGVGNPILNIALVTFRQKITPKPLLGRVNASARVLIMSSLPVGSLLVGALAQLVGTAAALWACGACLLALILVLGRRLSRLSVTPLP